MSTIVKWAPFPELDTIERRMRRMLLDFGPAPAPLLAADLYETEEEVVVELELPGFEEKELGIEVSDHTLTVKGERKEEREKEEKTFHVHERLERSFERRFLLPEEVDTKKVKATFDKGILEVHVAKTEELVPRTIAIEKP